MFDDGRGKKVIVLVHCVLNQNARMYPYAKHKGAVTEIIDFLMKKDYGMLQIPCPEFLFMGLERLKRTKEHPEVWHVLNLPEGRKKCRKIAEDIAMQIRQYIDNGFYVAAVLGKNASPSCGVTISSVGDDLIPGPGVFIQELQKVFEEQNINVPIVGCPNAENESEEVLDWLKANLK